MLTFCTSIPALPDKIGISAAEFLSMTPLTTMPSQSLNDIKAGTA